MFSRIRELIGKHLKNNANTYFFLLLAFIIGVSAGAFTVNGLSSAQKEELVNYFKGFLQLLDNQKVDSGELLEMAFIENIRIVGIIWFLGVTIIGIPFIYVVIGIRGFISGFSSGFIIESMGLKGVLFSVLSVLPKELIIVPCIIALGVYGINFSLNIIKGKSIRHLPVTGESLKTSFASYCAVTLFYTGIIFIGVFVEAYIIPVIIKIAAPLVST